MTTDPVFHSAQAETRFDRARVRELAVDDGGAAQLPDGRRDAPRALSGLLIILGGVSTGLAAAFLLSFLSTSRAPVLERVSLADVGAAEQSLFASNAFALAEEAKNCRRPLAAVALRAAGPAGGVVRVRSGAYRSPNIKVGPGLEKLALPFPAPIEAGQGQIFVEAESDGIDMFLRPGVVIPAGKANTIINVTWDPKSPCR